MGKKAGRFGSYAKGQRILSLTSGLDIKVSDLISWGNSGAIYPDGEPWR